MADNILLEFQNPHPPKWLPIPEHVVQDSETHGQGPYHFVMHSPDGSDHVFVKYGPLVAMEESATQHFVATQVNSDDNAVVLVPCVYYAFRHKGVGYIVMEFINGSNCTNKDLDAIASAIRRLKSIPSPTTSPGPPAVKGPISHQFFARHRSSIPYRSVKALQDHINSILAQARYDSKISFRNEDLRLCLDDIRPDNFLKDTSGQIFAIDYGRTNFLPSAFQDLSFAEGGKFARDVEKSLKYIRSGHWGDLLLAKGRLQVFDDNMHALPKSLSKSIGLNHCRDENKLYVDNKGKVLERQSR